MPPSRRKPPQPTPRRPRVAGLHKPAGKPSPRPRPEPAEAEQEPADEATTVDALTGEPSAGAEESVVDSPVEEQAEEPAEPAESIEDTVVQPGADADAPEKVTPKPIPRRKARDSGTTKPESEAVETEPEPAEGEDEPVVASPEQKARKKKFILAGALILVGLLLAGLAVFFKVKQNEVDSATGNAALLDMAKTAQVQQDVRAAVEALFSYDFNDLGKTKKAANDVLVTDTARDKYNKEFAEVERLAPQQKMVVTVKVTRTAPILIDGDRAKVLVFVDQTSIRTGGDPKAANNKVAGGSQLSVTAQLSGGKWKVADLDAYNGGTPTPQGEQPLPLPGGQQQPPPSK
ncbi:hypothetical protein [Amycolatopsis sp. CA-230715]|uniref:hypothetical protein n=1 Tax=Amycolatopsis sp. CA-230715 TaxID=2745196 RepID=UPI001C01A6BE|nr:hypothetical protein [Amycolatopsis sp. CA-230715]QWF79694.1 hypothetical protein HUW46_03103 [Amycolatopsis sp. CA-230715]